MTASAGHGQRITMSRVDRQWVGSTVVTAIGPLRVPDREAVVDAFVAIAGCGPDARLGLRYDEGSTRHWVYRTDDLHEYARSCIASLEPGADADMDALLNRLEREHGADRPVRIFLADRHLVAMVSHAIGDSRLIIAMLPALVAWTEVGALPVWATARTDPHPLRTALRHTFHSRAEVGRLISARHRMQVQRAAVERPPDAVVPFRPHPVAISEMGEPDGTRPIRSWARTHAPGSAHFAVVLALVHQGLVEQGIACAPGVHMVFDLRRYLPRPAVTTGNFVGGLDLPVPATDLRGVTEAVTEAAKVGHPLAALTASVIISGVTRRPAPPTTMPAQPQARLALSYIGPRTTDDRLPWVGDVDDRMYWARVDPAGPTAMTVLAGLVGRRQLLSASFHSTVFNPDAVRRALQAVNSDPVGLLERARDTADSRS